MDIRQLRYFVAIVEARSFSKAALALRVAQPALSLHVRNMEADLGTELLIRTPQGVIATPAGTLLLERARGIIADFEALKRAVAGHDSEPAGEVRLGLPGTIGERLSVPLILAVRGRHPKVRLKIAEAMSGYVLEWLFDERADLGLLYLGVDERGLRSMPILSEELRLFGTPEAMAAAGFDSAPATPAGLAALPLVLPGPGHGLRALLDERMEAEGLVLSTFVEVESYAAIRDLVGRGIACSILPRGAVEADVRTGRFSAVPIGDPPLSRTVHLVRPFDRPATGAAEAVEALCRSELARLVEDGRWPATLL